MSVCLCLFSAPARRQGPAPSVTCLTRLCLSVLSSGPPGSGPVSHLLTVNDLSTGRQFSVPASADTTVGRIKTDVAALTEWPLDQQSWNGWPEHVTDAVSAT